MLKGECNSHLGKFLLRVEGERGSGAVLQKRDNRIHQKSLIFSIELILRNNNKFA